MADDDQVPPQIPPQQPPQAPQLGLGALQNAFHNIQMELRAGRMGKRIPDFNGDGSRRFREWLADVERIGAALNADDGTIKALCFESLKGPAAEHFSRINRNYPGAPWQQVRQALIGQYSDIGDNHLALQKLRRIRQKRGETIQSFVERIRSLGQEAYPNQNHNNPLIQDSLIGALIDGVCDDHIARKLIRERPDDFEDAVTISIREQQAAKHFSMRRQTDEEPMNVSQVSRPKLDEKVDQLCDQLDRLLPQTQQPIQPIVENLLAKVDSLEQRVSNQSRYLKQQSYAKREGPSKPRQDKRQWTTDGKPICLYCQKAGHIQKDCRKRRFDLAKTPTNRQSSN